MESLEESFVIINGFVVRSIVRIEQEV